MGTKKISIDVTEKEVKTLTSVLTELLNYYNSIEDSDKKAFNMKDLETIAVLSGKINNTYFKDNIRHRFNSIKNEYEVNFLHAFNTTYYTLDELMELQKELWELWEKTKDHKVGELYNNTELMRLKFNYLNSLK